MTEPEFLLRLFKYLDKADLNEQARRASEIIVQAISKASKEEKIDDPAVWLVAFKFGEDLMLKFMNELTATVPES
jgi:hypothetical protein